MDLDAVSLSSQHGESGVLRISQLPSKRHPLERRDDRLVLREGGTYRYSLEVTDDIVRLEPAELFEPDDLSLRTGRVVPGESVGLVRVRATTSLGEELVGLLDVRTEKFSDEQAFSTMLADLASMAVESLHQGFAPAAGAFGLDPESAPRLVYQQFAVLQALLTSGELRWALTHVLHQPNRAWFTQAEPHSASEPLRGSSRLSRQLSRPGRRIPTQLGALASLPSELHVERTEETLDTIPNRFVRFVLERWRGLAQSVLDSAAQLSGAARQRGTHEAKRVLDELDELLGQPLFREVARLSSYPKDNQVLLRKEGYRQILGAATLVESSLGLEVDIDDPILVSRRSVATLYEYWTFAKLATALFAACGRPGVEGELFRPAAHGMSLVLKAQASSRLALEATVDGQPVLAELFFNNEFRSDSWTRPMRPDASLVLRRPGDREIWLHFDAKYRVDWSKPFDTGEPLEEEAAERLGASKRTDLLKMHAYRDAIRRSAGSYVLFPGSRAAEFSVSADEFLPGLGAFPLRPDRAADDQAVLQAFLGRALRHVAAAGTRHRRATYWTDRAYAEAGTDRPDVLSPFDVPPADTSVLVGYVRSDAQWQWIDASSLYNVRSGDRRGAVSEGAVLLDSPLLLLQGVGRVALFRRADGWRAAGRKTLVRLGYPSPRGQEYLLTGLALIDQPIWLSEIDLARLRPARNLLGEPFAVSWLELVLSTQPVS